MRSKKPRTGNLRTVTKFAWFPVCLFCGDEWRWLEKVTVEQMYVREWDRWENCRFIDDDGQEET